MVTRLTRGPRIDTLQNEMRRRRNSWDRWIYFGLVGAFLIWIGDLFVGDLFYLSAEGLVLSDRVVLATQFPAQIEELRVVEDGKVKAGEVVARLRSKEVEETLAKLSADIASATARATQFAIRRKVIEAVRSTAQRAVETANLTRAEAEQLISKNLISNKRIWEMIDDELKSRLMLSQMEAEDRGIDQDLPQLQASIEEASLAREQLKRNYNDGRIESPVDGIVGHLPVSKGSVARLGEPLMEIFTGDPYVLAYVPEGAFYSLHTGDPVNIAVGLKTYLGEISDVFPVTAQLPRAFQDTVRPPPRAQVVRITFASGQELPTLFAKPRIRAASWMPRWLASESAAATPPVSR